MKIYIERRAVAQDTLSIHINVANSAIRRDIYQAPQRFADRHHRRLIQIDQDKVGFRTRRQAADIVAPQCSGTAACRSVEDVQSFQIIDGLRYRARVIGGAPHLFQKIMRISVGPDSQVHTGPYIGAESSQRDAAAQEDGRAMRDRGAGLRQEIEILSRRPM